MEHGETWELCVCVQDKLGQMLAANLLGTESDTGEARAAAADADGRSWPTFLPAPLRSNCSART